MSSVFPEYATEAARQVDHVQFFIFLVMAFWFIACNAVLVYFVFRYKRKGPDDKVSTVKGNHTLEVVWTVIPTILVLGIFYYGIKVWAGTRTMPDDKDAYVVDITGQKWSWSYRYPDGQTTDQDLYVPQGEVVKLRMNSLDVLHSFFIPEFRIKEDVVPSFYTYLWFKADRAGVYNIFCTEYCGNRHSQMLGKLHVLTPEEWAAFKAKDYFEVLTPLEHGKDLYVKKACVGCHTTDGSASIGPTFKGIIGRQETLTDGRTLTVDFDYIERSINKPDDEIVAGYPKGQMPAFEGQLTKQDIQDIYTFLETLK